MALWEEKLALRPTFAGNAATAWGTVSEDTALQRCAGSRASAFAEGCIATRRTSASAPLFRDAFKKRPHDYQLGHLHCTQWQGAHAAARLPRRVNCIARSSKEAMRMCEVYGMCAGMAS